MQFPGSWKGGRAILRDTTVHLVVATCCAALLLTWVTRGGSAASYFLEHARQIGTQRCLLLQLAALAGLVPLGLLWRDRWPTRQVSTIGCLLGLGLASAFFNLALTRASWPHLCWDWDIFDSRFPGGWTHLGPWLARMGILRLGVDAEASGPFLSALLKALGTSGHYGLLVFLLVFGAWTLGLFPLFRLAGLLAGRETAWRTVALWTLVPGATLCTLGSFDALQCVVAVSLAYLVAAAARESTESAMVGWIPVMVALFLALFLSFVPLVLIPLLLVVAVSRNPALAVRFRSLGNVYGVLVILCALAYFVLANQLAGSTPGRCAPQNLGIVLLSWVPRFWLGELPRFVLDIGVPSVAALALGWRHLHSHRPSLWLLAAVTGTLFAGSVLLYPLEEQVIVACLPFFTILVAVALQGFADSRRATRIIACALLFQTIGLALLLCSTL